MDINQVDMTKEYTFSEALQELLYKSNIIITSKKTGDSYKIDKLSKVIILKIYNPVIASWQRCTYILPEEIFDAWYITAE